MANTILKTPEIASRLKELQQHHNHSDSDVATILSISPHIYKNIIRKAGGNKYIDLDIIHSLSDHYGCSTDYILCLSNDPQTDRNGRHIIKPISFNEWNQEITEISNYLKNDGKTLSSLYFILHQLPSTYRCEILRSINALTDLMRMTSFIARADSLTPDKFSALENCLIYDDANYTDALICLSEADAHLGKKRRERALKKYLEVIYARMTKSARITPLAKKAVDSILSLKAHWPAFPQELDELAKALPNLHDNLYHEPESCIKKTIEIYLKLCDNDQEG